MFLKRIEMTGFKSFADRAVMELEFGVITIVGPNGCGKSNVSDALRWVFGEQNPRVLRGNQMEDIIFNGTDERKAIGRAEVSVTFEGCDGVLPLGYHEVTITRRLFRSGESQYLINQSPCLLRDIRELFMGTGIGTNAYFLLEQGKIDMVLSAKPEDRRSVFEEAAGIMKYKIKKKASLQRLELTQANLVRLADIIREVKRQIISLERQAGKARRYQEAREELKKLELKVARRDFEDRKTELEELDSRLLKRSIERDAIQGEVRSLQQKIQEVERSHRAIFDELVNLEKKDLELYHKIQNVAGEIALLKERILEFEARIKSDSEEMEQAKARLENLRGQFREEEDNKNKFLKENNDEKLDLETRKASVQAVITQYDEGQDTLGVLKGKFIDLKQQESQYKNQMMVYHHREKDLVLRREKLLTEREKVACHLKEKETERSECKIQRDQLAAENALIQENFKVYQTQKGRLESERQRITLEIEREKEQYLRATARREAAREFGSFHQEPLETRGTAFDSILKMPGVYRKAIKASLGVKLGCVLKQNRLSIAREHSAIFFPLDTAIPVMDRSDFSTLTGFLGYASDLVNCVAGYENAVKALLGNIVILQDFNALKNVPDALLGRYRFVTLEGDWIDCDGVWECNVYHEDAEVDLAQMETLITSTLDCMQKLEFQKRPLDQQYHALTNQIASEEAKFHQRELELANVTGQFDRLSSKIKDLSDEGWSLDQEEKDLSREIVELDEMVRNISKNLADIAHLEKDISQEIKHSESALNQLERHKETALIELAEVKVMSRSLEDEEKRFQQRLNDIQTSMNELDRLIARRMEDLSTGASKREESEKRIEVHVKDIEGWHQEADATQTRKEEVQQRVQGITESIQNDQEKLIHLSKTVEKLREELSSDELKKSQAALQRENILQRMKEKYDLNLEEVSLEGGLNLEEIQPRIIELQEKLRQMGDVNLVAIQEFDEYRNRYDFLLKQEADMIHAKEDLTKAIQKINITIRELFLETFEKIRGTFNDLFRKLFGGGRAILELMDENDILECGINIAAQPPGKKLQTISLLSGGERTLTALALLLAIFKVRPSPFCFMDEMDAALDESNILRFLSLLDEFKIGTQFILITHNKRTVGIADIVYGVTMEESGVSKLVSIRLPSPKEQHDEKDEALAVG